MPLPKLAILGSGNGTNMTAIANACQTGALPAQINLILTDNPNASILQRAQQHNIPAQHIPPGPYRTKLSHQAEQTYIQTLQQHQTDWIILAGFMRIIQTPLLRAYPEHIINIHPSLLPSFPGLNAPAQALRHGVHITGTTVHIVDQGIDTGAIIAQQPVPIHPNDTPQTLHKRIQTIEHQLYPTAITNLLTHKITIHGRRAIRHQNPQKTPTNP